ncbi:MAG TPA: hypothetical protein DDZ51_22995 [Planctomycetaceae bacterium]|nr:hypothetical protein [Planctomycetaceae bacterium]
MKLTTQQSPSPRLARSIDHGTGPTLLLLHGVTRCGEDWQPLISALATRWRTITIDQRGHGLSSRESGYLVADYVADVVRLVRDELESPLVIFGHSLGAMVAAGVAAQLPKRVRGIVLEDPPFHTMGNRIAGTAWHAQFIGMRAAAQRGGDINEIADALEGILLPSGDGGFKRLGEMRDRASLQWNAQCLSQLDPEVLTPVIEGRWLDGFDVHAELSRIDCPTLLLQADPKTGGALTDGDAEAACAAIASCWHVRFAGCGHQLHRDRPQEVLRKFDDFVTSMHLVEKSPKANHP